ncbi:hypothetical protein BO82DRAFT_136437 [Aspergillus uvarum CBS 121591]|uniref:Uncharacterized protein n=1 Tax=Aspergillus uvarum CBS 121591 TaxID=1448315 RepID=A0A319C5H8_9EURO|nr:hypothetical protein BO82DRAFT_136437 [Aspergillus uvarum CBS 121591]PYH79207.1 hypothetical protein BO82DRAFT_136437 [Aspergillus uvarum CBS 121591]
MVPRNVTTMTCRFGMQPSNRPAPHEHRAEQSHYYQVPALPSRGICLPTTNSGRPAMTDCMHI